MVQLGGPLGLLLDTKLLCLGTELFLVLSCSGGVAVFLLVLVSSVSKQVGFNRPWSVYRLFQPKWSVKGRYFELKSVFGSEKRQVRQNNVPPWPTTTKPA